MDSGTLSCVVMLLVGFFVYYWFRFRPRTESYMRRRQERLDAARREGEEIAIQKVAEEMGISAGTFEQLEMWVERNQHSSGQSWPFVTDVRNLRKTQLRLGTLSEITQHYGGHAGISLRAIYYGVQLADDDGFQRQWNELVGRHS